MKRLVAIWAIVALIAMISPQIQAQEAWNIDSVRFERNWPDSLVGRFLNTETVLPLPWGGTVFGVQGLTQQSLLGVWIEDVDGNWSHRYLPLPTGISHSVEALALAQDADGSTVLLAGTDNGPYGSVDSGRTWQPRNGLTIQQLDEGERGWWSTIEDIYDEGNGCWWAISSFDGPAFSDNYGLSWQLITAGLYHRGEGVFNTGLVYQGSDGQIWLQGEDALYRLNRPDVRDGQTWQWIPLRDGIEYNLVDGRTHCRPILAIFPNGKCDDGSGLMYCWSGWGLIYQSDDFGANWSQMTDQDDWFPNPVILKIAGVPTMAVNQSGLLFIGAPAGGLFVYDGQWHPIGGRDNRWQEEWEAHYEWWHSQFGGILDLSFDVDGYLIIGTWDGAIRSTIPMNGVIEEPNSVSEPVFPESHILLSAYPNPFNGVLRIRIDAGNQPFSLSIFDSQGRLIKDWSVIPNGVRNLAGSFANAQDDIVWNASNVPSGQYFVQASSYSQTSQKTLPVLLMK
ncbi:MAG: T9SS type A sorting domain-containing protein [bacterium]|nr:T9SS type A sorting domain-containing protein [bacterium]